MWFFIYLYCVTIIIHGWCHCYFRSLLYIIMSIISMVLLLCVYKFYRISYLQAFVTINSWRVFVWGRLGSIIIIMILLCDLSILCDNIHGWCHCYFRSLLSSIIVCIQILENFLSGFCYHPYMYILCVYTNIHVYMYISILEFF